MAPVHMERGIRSPPRLDSCPNYPRCVFFIADDREVARALGHRAAGVATAFGGNNHRRRGTTTRPGKSQLGKESDVIGILIAVLFAALVWAICVALGLPAIVGIVAAILVLLAGIPSGGYGLGSRFGARRY